MMRFVIVLVGPVMLLSAAEWQAEQVTSSQDSNSYMPVVVLDSGNKPGIIFTQGTTEGPYRLNAALRTESAWTIREIEEIPDGSIVYFSGDFSPANHMYVAFSTKLQYVYDLYLASDSSGNFETMQLTDDPFEQFLPVVKVGTDNVVRIVYKEQNDTGFNIRYGWLDAGVFHSESIKDTMLVNPFDFDFILDQENNPHVFFTGDDDTLYHATRIAANNWSIAKLGVYASEPSAALGPSRIFYVVYIGLGKLRVLSNPGGTWSSEEVASAPAMYNYDYPAVALDDAENPHLVWHRWEAPYSSYPDFMNEVFYSGKNNGTWSEPDSMPPPGNGKSYGYVHPFRTDKNGFGHITYMVWTETKSQIFYAKTSQPLSTGIAESSPPPRTRSPFMEITGSIINFNLPRPSFIRITLYDASGRMVNELASGYYPAGRQTIEVGTREHSGGVYFVRGEIEGQKVGAKLIVYKK